MDEDRFKLLAKLMPDASKMSAVNDCILLKIRVERNTSPLLQQNDLKQKRLSDEKKSNILDLSISTPRDEFAKELSDKTATAGFNKSLMVNMFHIDFRYNMEAVQWLQDDIAGNAEALICNLDLVFKWLALLLIDSIQLVTLRIFDYVGHILETMITQGYECTYAECACFLSCLVTKFGDPDEIVRNKVRLLLRRFFSPNEYKKIFFRILIGLDLNNTQQRAECLAELNFLVDLYGISAFCPSPGFVLREVSHHISDPQSSVSRAAVNLWARAYFLLEGDIGDLIGAMKRKDQALVEKRIRRAEKECMLLTKPTIAPFSVDVIPGLKFGLYLIITIRKMGNRNLAIASDAAKEITKALKTADLSLFRGYEEAFITSVCAYFKQNLSPMPRAQKAAKAEPLLLSLKYFYMNGTLGRYIGVDLLKNLMILFLELAEAISPKDREHLCVDRVFVKINLGSNFTNANCALLCLLKKTLSYKSSSKPTMPISLKCLRANVIIFPKYADELRYDTILMELHNVTKTLPIEMPEKNKLRTDFLEAVKMMVEKLVLMKGHDILNHMKEIPEDCKLYRDVKMLLQDDKKMISSTSPSVAPADEKKKVKNTKNTEDCQ